MAAKLGSNAITKGGSLKDVLGAPAAKQILTDAYQGSIVGKLAGGIPMPINGTKIVFPVSNPVAGIVGEGELKPVINHKLATKTASPIKAAAVVYHSKELRLADEVGFYSYLKNATKEAVSKAIDMAVIHGKNAMTNTKIDGVEAIADTKNKVTLGTAAANKGGLTADILAGYELVVNSKNKMTGFAADDRMRVKLLNAVDNNGRPIFSTSARGGVNLSDTMGDLLGLPVTYGEAVAGALGTVEDTNIRLIGGDFKNNLKFGFVENITYRYTDTGTIQDGDVEVNLFQQNMEAFIFEAIFGWVIRDVNGFVTYSDAPAGEDVGA